jgi:salicylate hydroxylase
VQSSRWIGDCYEWQAQGIGRDLKKIEKEIEERNGIIADFDIEGSIANARRDLQIALGGPKL